MRSRLNGSQNDGSPSVAWIEGVDPDLARFLVRSESDSIELRGLWESLLSHQ